MPDVTTPVLQPLGNLPGIELLHAGEWAISTGVATFTTEDLADAIAAFSCPGMRRPVIKLGHLDERFNPDGSDPRFNAPDYGAPNRDGQPNVGWVDNLRLADEGSSLIGDFRGMPGWMVTPDVNGNRIITSAYPDRSIEGAYGFRCQLGHSHRFVLTAVALLGVVPPGIGTLDSLQDIAALYGVAAGPPVDDLPPSDGGGRPFAVRVSATAPTRTGAMIALLPSSADCIRLAVDGGEPVEQLHTTLMYLGKAADLDANARTRITDTVRAIASSTARFDADGFALSIFNPTSSEQDTAIVLGVSGTPVDQIHDAVTTAINGLDLALPDQHSPWVAHVTLTYSDDLTQVPELVDRTGPVTFDRVRIAFADTVTDLPLTGSTTTARSPTMPHEHPAEVSAGVSTDDVRRAYYDTVGWSHWITEMHLDPELQLIVVSDDDSSYARVTVQIDGDQVTFAAPVPVEVQYVDRQPVAASAGARVSQHRWSTRDESQRDMSAPADPVPVDGPAEPTGQPAVETGTQPEPPASQTPAAEPVPPTHQEDDMSLTEVRQRLGLDDNADEQAILAALDDVVTKATAPPTVTPEPVPVAASGADPETLQVIKDLSGRVAEFEEYKRAAVAATAETAKRNLFDAAINSGRITPAERPDWESRYDRAPEVIADVIGAFAAGTAVPVTSAGTTGPAEMDNANQVTDAEAGAWAGLFNISAEELTHG